MKKNFTALTKNFMLRLLPAILFLAFSTFSFGQTLHVVEVSDTKFDPAELEIMPGDTVEWRNVGGYHNVNGTRETYPDNPESFGNNEGNDWVYQYVFNVAGIYNYQCDPHVSLGMTGSVTVQGENGNGEEFTVSVDFTGMNPHVGQNIYLAVREAGFGMEVGRTKAVADTAFTLSIPGIETGMSYYVEFWVDFNENGRYDSPPVDHAWQLQLNDVTGDTTLMFAHNTDFTDIMWHFWLTVEFTGMNPHVGQDIYLATVDNVTGMEISRSRSMADTAFSISVPGIEPGMSYTIDFWVDFNENGMYDTPPTDHAWRLELNDVMGDTTLMFVHNTDFTDIMWKNQLTVEFTGMNPHVGEDFYLSVTDVSSGMEVGRTHTIADTDFTVKVPGIEAGKSYHVDFWADFNENGMYDTPPTDHAWRLELNDVMGDTTLMFVHNTNFTDIMWKSSLTVEFTGMNPHVGEDFYLSVTETGSGMEIGRTHTIADTAFSVTVPGIEAGKSYHVDFWADFNENGMYDTPPTDHAWRLELNDVMGDTTLLFVHNTDFTDIMWKYMLTIEFTEMNPHMGQDFYLAVTDTSSGMEIGRKHMVADSAFSVMVPGIETGMSYYIDFWADFNENGMYDTPPTDHAWRLELNDVMGDTTIMFVHNTDFTDIMWKNMLTVEFTGMTPHVGQLFKLYVVNAEDETVVDSVTVDAIPGPDFSVQSAGIASGGSYLINFYADFNENGMYDAPPTDHAWQLELENVTGDTTLMFAHNTDFTDIFPVTSVHKIGNIVLKMYPNPATDRVFIESDALVSSEYTLSVYDISGRLNAVEQVMRNNRIEVNTRSLTKGIYFIELKSVKDRTIMKLIKQ
jgi:plastocyanin/predicted secreted Zn-dependent protease